VHGGLPNQPAFSMPGWMPVLWSEDRLSRDCGISFV
jgi:hypothetical protein